MRYFPINNPTNGFEQRIYYNSEDNKKELLEKYILEYWEEYCNTHWIWLGKFEENKFNYEDKVKHFLNRCANFLLMGEYERSNIMSGKDIGRIQANELSLEGDWQNESLEIDLDDTIDYLNNHMKMNFSRDSKILETEFDNKPIQSNKKHKSKTIKMLHIYSEEEKEVDDYERVHISNTFNIWRQYTKKIPARKGIIDKSKSYIAGWCIVDTENIFEFKGNKYKISEDIPQYSIRIKKPRYDDYKSDYQMDQILVYEQEGSIFFFDQNIEQIENEKIIKL